MSLLENSIASQKDSFWRTNADEEPLKNKSIYESFGAL